MRRHKRELLAEHDDAISLRRCFVTPCRLLAPPLRRYAVMISGRLMFLPLFTPPCRLPPAATPDYCYIAARRHVDSAMPWLRFSPHAAYAAISFSLPP